MPSDNNPTGYVGVPLFDKSDLDSAIERWKALRSTKFS
jgi:hypothetical protein